MPWHKTKMKVMSKCIICGNPEQSSLYDNLLLKCTSCGFITANMDISNEEIETIYTANYFKGEEYEDYIRDKKIIQNNFTTRIKHLEKVIPESKRKSILEIGCGYGFFGELVSDFWNSKYLGIDICKEAIEYASAVLKLNVIREDYLEMNYRPDEFDTCVMLDVIEHLPDPDRVVKKLSNEVKRGGYLVISTGDIGSLLARINGRKWRMIHPPSHLHYFNRNTLTKLLTLNGFEVVDISYPVIKRSIKQIFFSLFILNRRTNNRVINKIFQHIPEKWLLPLNTFDIMLVISRRT